MRVPGMIWAHQLADKRNPWPQAGLPDGRWALSRPEPFYSVWQRWHAAWLVFTGRADALLWTDQ